MDLITLNRIKLMHPQVRQEVLEAYTHVNNKLLGKGVRLRFAYTLRTIQEQNEFYAQGRTKLFDKKGNRLGIVTNARGGQSIHNYGLAFDIVLLIDKNGDGNFETASWDIRADHDKDKVSDWMEVVNYFKSIGWAWGGDWKSFPDYPHFEKTFGLGSAKYSAWQVLQNKYEAGNTFEEVIDGKVYEWVNI